MAIYEQIVDDSDQANQEPENVNEDNPEYDGLEVQVTYHQPPVANIRGNYITKLETEILYDESGDATWSKVKYVLGEGTIRPQSWGNWFLYYHVARENFYAGKPFSEQFTDGEVGNSIFEAKPLYVEATDWGHWGVEFGISHESVADGLFTPSIRGFGSYRLTDKLEIFSSAMLYREMFYKEGNTDKNILETDTALLYHFNRGHIGLGYFAKFGDNIDDDLSRVYEDGSSSDKFGEVSELIWKPRLHYRFANGLGATLFGEYGKYKDKTTKPVAGQTYDLYEEWFWKAGIFVEYPIRPDIILFGEANYRDGRVKETYTGTSHYETHDRNHDFAMIGVNFLF